MMWLPGRTRFGLYKATISEVVYKEYRNKRQILLYLYFFVYCLPDDAGVLAETCRRTVIHD